MRCLSGSSRTRAHSAVSGVVRSDGTMGRYGGGEAAKRTLLEHEHALP